MSSDYIWFLITIFVSLSNIFFSFIAYYYLQEQKRLNRKLIIARDIAFYYSIGMMFVLIFSIGFFILLVPV